MGFCKAKKCLILFLNVSIFNNSCIIQYSLLVLYGHLVMSEKV